MARRRTSRQSVGIPLRERSTSDLIALVLTALVSFVIAFAIIAGTVWKIIDGDAADVDQLLFRIGNLVNTLIGVVAGYLAGRSVGNANQSPEPPAPAKPRTPSP